MKKLVIILNLMLLLNWSIYADAKMEMTGEKTGFRLFMYEKLQGKWIRNNCISRETVDFLNEIEESYNEGLQPEMYLKRETREILKNTERVGGLYSITGKIDERLLNNMVTDAFIKYTKDMYFGITHKKYRDQDNIVKRDELPYYDKMMDLNRYGYLSFDVNGIIEQFRPKIKLYNELIKLHKKIDRIEKSGAWRLINDYREIVVNTSSEAVFLVRSNLVLLYGKIKYENENYYDDELKTYVKKFQKSMGLNDNGIINEYTIRALNRIPSEVKKTTEANMERLRKLQIEYPEKYIWVNIPSYKLNIYNNEKLEMEMKVVVGKKDRKTPTLINTMRYFVVNPTWTIPENILKNDIIAAYIKDPEYLKKNKIKVLTDNDDGFPEIDPTTLKWEKDNIKPLRKYKFVQESDEKNALGKVKFLLENKENIYLHDTQAKALFNKKERMFSSGCIRLEAPVALAEYLFALGKKGNKEYLKKVFEKNKDYYVGLPKPIKVYIVYLTMYLNEKNEVVGLKDIYDKDSEMNFHLAKIKKSE